MIEKNKDYVNFVIRKIKNDLMKRKSSGEEENGWNLLSDDQKQELMSSAKESEDLNNLVSNDDLKAKHKKWL